MGVLKVMRVWQLTRSCVTLASLTLAVVTLSACEKKPPAQRPAVTLPVYQQGDVENGKKLYAEQCQKCHKLTPGYNEKGPQLMRVYGAKAASLADYKFTDALSQSQLTWTADNLDHYIANPREMVKGTRMRSDPIADAKARHDIIAYLSTLR